MISLSLRSIRIFFMLPKTHCIKRLLMTDFKKDKKIMVLINLLIQLSLAASCQRKVIPILINQELDNNFILFGQENVPI